MELIYHYTSGARLEKILASGKLKVSEFEKINNIKPPALWLSTNPVWENTATKTVRENGIKRSLTREEQHQKIGLVRFVLEFKKDALCSWAKYKYNSNTPIQVYMALESDGIDQGANPKEWYTSFEDIPLAECIACEIWDGKKWVSHI